jgi:HD-GYP domain-containing protein (c-di-GMP phosphodiesterase class II)
MTTDRPYRDAMTADEARAELVRCAGSQFDPDVVAALVRVSLSGAG